MFARSVLDFHDREVVRLMPDCLRMTADCCAALTPPHFSQIKQF